MYYCCGISDKGAVCDSNEDAVLINKRVFTDDHEECELEAPFIAAVADGVGGENAGEVASRMALEQLSALKYSKKTDLSAKLMNIHTKLRRYAAVHSGHANMQTTLCALAVDEDERAFAVNVGDSRMYRCRGGCIRQLSTDQSLVQMLYEQGRITADEKKTHAQKNVIFPVLGNASEEPQPCITEIIGGVQRGDIIIICSDGLSDYITQGEFEEILALPMRLPRRIAKLAEAAIKNGSPDNVSVVGVSMV